MIEWRWGWVGGVLLLLVIATVVGEFHQAVIERRNRRRGM